MSINVRLVRIRSASSPICSLTASLLQQRTSKAKVEDLTLQNTLLQRVKEFGYTTKYIRPNLEAIKCGS